MTGIPTCCEGAGDKAGASLGKAAVCMGPRTGVATGGTMRIGLSVLGSTIVAGLEIAGDSAAARVRSSSRGASLTRGEGVCSAFALVTTGRTRSGTAGASTFLGAMGESANELTLGPSSLRTTRSGGVELDARENFGGRGWIWDPESATTGAAVTVCGGAIVAGRMASAVGDVLALVTAELGGESTTG